MRSTRCLAIGLAVLGLSACRGAGEARPPAVTAPTEVLALGEDLPGAAPEEATAPPPTAAPPDATPTATAIPLPELAIARMRARDYPASDIVVEQTLSPGANYSRQVVSYRSDGLKIFALLTLPKGERPPGGWPVILFNHGYIPPAQYRTTERYVKYVDAFARNGYIVLKSDYRGHGSSEGEAGGGYGAPDYTVDVLNALAAMKAYPDADPERIGMWGHSMGGQVTLRSMVVSPDIKAGVIWAGVVASYPDLFSRWRRPTSAAAPPAPPGARRGWRSDFVERYGSPEENPAFWAAISPNGFLADISGPLQLHHGTADHSVPLLFSELLKAELETAGEPVELFTYEGDDHNLSRSLGTALERSVAFFDRHVKGTAGE